MNEICFFIIELNDGTFFVSM